MIIKMAGMSIIFLHANLRLHLLSSSISIN